MEKYSIEQYPSNKKIQHKLLSDDQINLRYNSHKKYKYGKKKKCKKCGTIQDITEYYIKDKNTGRRSNKCRDCELKDRGIIEVGKQRFAYKIYDKGFRRCSVCKDIKSLDQFPKHKKQYGGISNTCSLCQSLLYKEYIIKDKISGSKFYLRQYAFTHYGIRIKTNEEYEIYRKEIENKNKPILFLDNKEFKTIRDFAKYVKDTYNINISTTERRIWAGYKEEQCKLSSRELRSIGNTKGKIKITDLITGKCFIFNNTKSEELKKLFGTGVRSRMKSNKYIPNRITKKSVYKNPFMAERIIESNKFK